MSNYCDKCGGSGISPTSGGRCLWCDGGIKRMMEAAASPIQFPKAAHAPIEQHPDFAKFIGPPEVQVKPLTSSVMIDHREWKNWRDTEHHGAIAKLNELLAPHGVVIAHKSDPSGKDFVELEAISFEEATE